MPSYKDYGIVLKSFSFGEFDKLLNIYTKENGLVRAIAKGSKKSGSKFGGKLEVLSSCFFHLAKGKNLHTVIDCLQVNSFGGLRLDLERLTYGLLYLEVVSNFAHEYDSDSEKIYHLLYFRLNELQSAKDPHLLTLWFLVGFLSIHGFKPQLETCVSCSQRVTMEYSFYPYSSMLGGLLCNKCSKVIDHRLVELPVLNIIESMSSQCFLTKKSDYDSLLAAHYSLLSKGIIREAMDLIMEHINVRAKSRIKSFDLLVTL